MEMDDKSGISSELTLGIREIFRIIVPGAYAILLIISLAPGSTLAKFAAASLSNGLAAAFFIGLAGYALQLHEVCFPYSANFHYWREALNKALGGGDDHIHEYKYFLETRAAGIKERIHYFSSFYYMLVEVSLFSGIAAIGMIVKLLHDVHCVGWLELLLAGATLVQLSLLGLRNYTRVFRRLRVAPLGMVLLWGLLRGAEYLSHCARISDTASTHSTIITLFALAYVFERLGAKHWKAVINEQLILVKDKSQEIRELFGGNANTKN
jgi:hypothetical protein